MESEQSLEQFDAELEKLLRQPPRRRGWLRQEVGDRSPSAASYELLGPWLLAALENGSQLLVDGDILFDAQRWARAAAMAHFALEEFGKCIAIMSLALLSPEKLGRVTVVRYHG